jgi:hypothetical protein
MHLYNIHIIYGTMALKNPGMTKLNTKIRMILSKMSKKSAKLSPESYTIEYMSSRQIL